MYSHYVRPLGLEYALRPCLPAGVKRTVRLAFFRDSAPDFSERDRAVLTLLRPHLHQAYLDAERRRHPVPRLTPRQWELLRLLAVGHTNIQLARRLGISEATVRTHLENIYERLNVSSRTAAVGLPWRMGAGSRFTEAVACDARGGDLDAAAQAGRRSARKAAAGSTGLRW